MPDRPPPRILHIFSSFDLGGKEARAVRLMNLWGDRARHSILSGVPGATGAGAAIDPGVAVDFPDALPLAGRPGLRRFHALARFMAGYDLLLSYNWGAMDAVMAHWLYGRVLRLPPLVHHEDGFNADEAGGLKPLRNLYRRIALRGAHALVVPSSQLEHIALKAWHQPPHRLHLIPNGIDTAAYAVPPAPDAIPGLVRTPGKLLVGTLAGLRPIKNLPRLVRAVATHRDRLQLVIVGEGPEREAILREAAAQGLADIHLPGFLPEPARYIGLFDIFALSSDSEQFPISLVEAMAAGLPVAATDVGDVTAMVCPENRHFIAADERGLAAALGALADDAELRRRIGAANREKARSCYAEEAMAHAYAALYGGALESVRIFL